MVVGRVLKIIVCLMWRLGVGGGRSVGSIRRRWGALVRRLRKWIRQGLGGLAGEVRAGRRGSWMGIR